jgi:hypothetical protein
MNVRMRNTIAMQSCDSMVGELKSRDPWNSYLKKDCSRSLLAKDFHSTNIITVPE